MNKDEKVVTPPGLEPGTYGLENRCSILLSYGAGFRVANISRRMDLMAKSIGQGARGIEQMT
jgi:hypothetical protein